MVAVIQVSCQQPWLEPGMKLCLLPCLLGAAVLSHTGGDAPNPPLSCVLSLGKILFRRSHVRDVAVKRLKPIDEYCRVRALGSAGQPSCLGGSGPPPALAFPCWVVLTSVTGKDGASQTPPRLTGQVETGRCLLPGSLQHFPWQTLCTGLVPHSLSKGSKPHLP